MVKITKKYKKITPTQSVALLKDKITKKYVWRHRYRIKVRVADKQEFTDYPHKQFKDFNAFKAFIEDQPLKEFQIK